MGKINLYQNSEQWEAWRASKIGASDANILMGKGFRIDKFGEKGKKWHFVGWDDLRQRQAGVVFPSNTWDDLDREWGKIMEPRARQILEKRYDFDLHTDVFDYEGEFDDKVVASLDGLNRRFADSVYKSAPVWVEIKCPVSKNSPYIRSGHWQDPRNPAWWQLVMQAAVLASNYVESAIKFRYAVLHVFAPDFGINRAYKIRVNRLLRYWPELKLELVRYLRGDEMGVGRELDLSRRLSQFSYRSHRLLLDPLNQLIFEQELQENPAFK